MLSLIIRILLDGIYNFSFREMVIIKLGVYNKEDYITKGE